MSASPMRTRPIYGGAFGMSGRYTLATQPCIERGLHGVRFMVLDPRAGAVLSVAQDKRDALSAARRLLRAAEALGQRSQGVPVEPAPLWPEEAMPALGSAGAKLRAVPRRRRAVFERSGGRCHYCGQVLTLDGRWNVEHMLPRALDGGDELDNLVAACSSCNLSKGDRTALEFMAGRPPAGEPGAA